MAQAMMMRRGSTGEAGPRGETGATGPQGPYFTPSVSAAGVLGWQNNGELPNPSSVDIAALVAAAVASERQLKRLTFHDVTVPPTAWSDTPTTEAAQIDGGYIVCATVPLTGATADMYPDAVLAVGERDSGNYSGVCASAAGGIILYAKTIPDEAIIIPTVVLWP